MVLPEFGVALEAKGRQSVQSAASRSRIQAYSQALLGHATENVAAAVQTDPDFPTKLPGRQWPRHRQQDRLPAFFLLYPFVYIASLHSLMH